MTKRETIRLGWKPEAGVEPYRESEVYVDCADGPDRASVAEVGLTMPASREEFRKMVGAWDMTTTSLPALAIFESTGQAVHVAYTIMAQPAQQDSMLRKSLVRILDSMSNLSPRLSAWLGQLRGEKSGSVNFEGLSSYDVRAQCTLIILAVRTRLPDPEKWALQAKYAHTDIEYCGRRVKRHAFSPEKATAIRSLAGWLMQTSALKDMPRDVMDLMVGKFYANHAKTEISFRALAKEYGGNHMTYARAFKKVKSLLRPLEDMALGRLHPYFVEQGIVADQDLDAA